MSKLYLISKSLLILSICQFLFLRCLAEALPADGNGKGLQNIIDSVSGKKGAENQEKEIKADPTQNYKLIAIYIVDKEPRALIKSLANPDSGAVEFKTGDFLDELQTISVSKISLSPTIKVELIDQEGVSYFIKPQVVVEKAGSTSSKSTYSRSLPSHFTGKTDKSKTIRTNIPSPAEQTEVTDTPKKEESPSTLDASTKPDQASATQEPSGSLKPALPPSQENAQTLGQGQGQVASDASKAKAEPAKDAVKSPPGAGLGRDRPGNPFGE